MDGPRLLPDELEKIAHRKERTQEEPIMLKRPEPEPEDEPGDDDQDEEGDE